MSAVKRHIPNADINHLWGGGGAPTWISSVENLIFSHNHESIYFFVAFRVKESSDIQFLILAKDEVATLKCEISGSETVSYLNLIIINGQEGYDRKTRVNKQLRHSYQYIRCRFSRWLRLVREWEDGVLSNKL